MRTDFDILGESAVYPGHPVTVAYCILNTFDSLGAAEVPSGYGFPAALGACEIPGAGGCVYVAMDLLRRMRDEDQAVEAVLWADGQWSRTDNQESRYPDRWREGQYQANELKMKLLLARMKNPKWWGVDG